jgi:hypothetical protein
LIFEHLKNSVAETTEYCPITLGSSQQARGSSLETAQQRRQYIPLCVSGVTSQVLNMSYRNNICRETRLEQVTKASATVIKFLLGPITPFRSEYSLLALKSAEIEWGKGKKKSVYVPGGLLFPILTAILISYESPEGITLIVESYGGKRRGHHIYGKFKKDMDAQHVKEVIARVKESEQLKIPFLIKKAFHILQSKKRSLVSKVSIHWGLGCDAVGNNLKEGEPSFLVCQPVNMKAVDTSRKGSASNVFRREEDIPDDPVTQDPTGSDSVSGDTSPTSTDPDFYPYTTDHTYVGFPEVPEIGYQWVLRPKQVKKVRHVPIRQR